MSQEFRAIYENGLLRPLDPIGLADRDVVSLIISSTTGQSATPSGGRSASAEFEAELEPLLFDGPSLPADFSRGDIYAERD
jgi:predicted DNA-binding antitoxin AbrB/MazE fold protein